MFKSEKIACTTTYDAIMSDCTLCPRNCHANRKDGERGFCGESAQIRAARAALHYWEEPSISGTAGSGAVFFTGCSLGCVYCQNHSIADGSVGKMISVERLAEIFLELQEQKANNINLVTATHFVPQVADALRLAKKRGLQIPVVYNTSGYEKVETLQCLDGLVDVYLPDFKYFSESLAAKYSAAANYPRIAKAALEEMVRQVETLQKNEMNSRQGELYGESSVSGSVNEMESFSETLEEGILQKGIIVRHLVLPGQVEESKRVIRYLYETYGDRIYISILNQYTPMPGACAYPELNRRVSEEEYDQVVNYAIDLGVENGYIQEGETAEESFIPKFDTSGI